MPALITAAATSASIAFAKWMAQRKREKAAKKAAEATFNENERQAFLRRQVLTQILKERGLAERYGLSDDTIARLVGSPAKYTGQTGTPGSYADLAGDLLGAFQTYQQVPKAPNAYGEGTLPPDFGPDSDFGTNVSGDQGSSIRLCPEGGLPDYQGNCPKPFGEPK